MRLRGLPRSRLGRQSLAVLTVAGAAGLAVGVGGALRSGGAVADLTRHPAPRMTAGQLSVGGAYRPCADTVVTADSLPTVSCPALPDTVEEDDAAEVAPASVADRLHADALGVLRMNPTDAVSLRGAIADLQTAVKLTGDSAAVLTDLAAAYLARAGLEQSPHELVNALDAASRAVRIDGRSRAARFNRALALEWLSMSDSAAAAWRDYLRVDSASPWASEARRRYERLAAATRPVPVPGPLSADSEVTRFVSRSSGKALRVGLDSLLPRWGAAVANRDAAAAEQALRLAERIGAALQRHGGDASLADAVGEVRAKNPSARGALAAGYATYGAAVAAYRAVQLGRAALLLGSPPLVSPPSHVLREWVTYYRGVTAGSQGKSAAEKTLRNVVAHNDARRYPALVGLAQVALGTMRGRATDLNGALAHYAAAGDAFARAGDAGNLGSVEFATGEARAYMGDQAESFRRLRRALTLLEHASSPVQLHNTLDRLADFSLMDGMPGAALTLSAASVDAAVSSGNALHVVEALLTRARVQQSEGDIVGARATLRSAERRLNDVQDFAAFNYLRADLDLLRAELAADDAPARSIAALDSAIPTLGNFPGKLRPALIARARARARLGDLSGAAADLDVVFEQVQSFRKLRGRAARLAPADDPSAATALVVKLLADRNMPAAALALEERARAALSLSGPYELSALRAVPNMPRGRVALRLARVGDEVFAWVVRGRSVAFARTAVSAATLDATVARIHAALDTSHPRDATDDLAKLYDWLIRPLRDDLGPPESTVVVLADGSLSRVPYAALMDRGSGRYFVDTYKIRLADSVLDAARADLDAAPGPTGVLLLAPTFDARANADLENLPGARREVESISRLYQNSVVREGASATPQAFDSLAQAASVIHFAGHGVADALAPGRSYLVLAPGADSLVNGHLSATALEGLHLHTRLVVLSACETLDPGRGAAGGFAGLSAALLGSGVGGVVGSLWTVSDRGTTRLMVAFHGHYARSGDAAGALRDAQRDLIRSKDPDLRSPAVWAAFEYAGRD